MFSINQSAIDSLGISIIYALVDVRNKIRYVGKTRKPPKTRLSLHLRNATSGKRTHKKNWLRECKKNNQLPKIMILEIVKAEKEDAAEVAWIARLTRLGYSLVNGTIGGDGVSPTEKGLQKRRLRFQGEGSNSAKLTEKDVVFMRGQYSAEKATMAELAEKYSVSFFTIWAAISGKSWKHIPGAVSKQERKRIGRKHRAKAMSGGKRNDN